MKKWNCLLAFLAAGLLAGCAGDEIARNLNNAEKLRVGMTKTQVLELMGRPLEDELYNTPDCWYYYVECRWRDGLHTQDECMPLVFQNEKLIGWGNEFQSKHNAVNQYR